MFHKVQNTFITKWLKHCALTKINSVTVKTEPTVRRGSSELFREVQIAFIAKWLSTVRSQTGTRVGSVKYESTDQYTSPTFFVVYTLWLFWLDPFSIKTKTSSRYDTNYFTCTLHKTLVVWCKCTTPTGRPDRETGTGGRPVFGFCTFQVSVLSINLVFIFRCFRSLTNPV